MGNGEECVHLFELACQRGGGEGAKNEIFAKKKKRFLHFGGGHEKSFYRVSEQERK